MRTLVDRHPAWLALLIVSGVAYTLAPQAGVAPWIKPLPALAAAAMVWLGGRTGHRVVTAALVVAAAGDVLLDVEGTARLGTLTFVLVVAMLAVGLRDAAVGPRWRGVALAGAWVTVSGVLVVPALGDRLVAGLLILGATAAFLAVAGRGSATLGLGALLIASNFTLFAVDLVVTPVPRWLVIGVYYVGLLLVAVDRTPAGQAASSERVGVATPPPTPPPGR